MPAHDPASDITQILLRIRGDDPDSRQAVDRLYVVVYAELRRVAGGLMKTDRSDHTLQPTALVHEAYLKLIDPKHAKWENRAHFFGVAAKAMRNVLIDYARRRTSAKRGGGERPLSLDDAVEVGFVVDDEILSLNRALDKLATEDERMARVVELRIFAGLTMQEVADALSVSKRTADSDWRVARLWLAREMDEATSE